MNIFIIALLQSFIWTTSTAQVQLLNVTQATLNITVSSTCLAVLNQAVTCDPSITLLTGGKLSGIPFFFNATQLASLCTTTCSSALATWERRIAGACGSTYWPTPQGTQYLPGALAESYVEAFNSACLENSAGQYCNLVIASALGVNLTNQQIVGPVASTAGCNGCFLSLLRAQLEMPMASTTDLATAFTSLTSSCSSTGWTVTNPPTATTFVIPPTSSSSAAPTCSGTSYKISSSDTCQSISMANSISSYDLLKSNSLQAFCRSFPTSGTLCIPSLLVCEPYTVKANDTCSSIQTQYNIIYSQILAWNPELGTSCTNIGQYVGYVICVSNPGGTWVNPSGATTSSAPTTTAPFFNTSLTAMSLFPTQTYVPMSNFVPYANGTRMDCAQYVTAPILTNSTSNTTSYACQDVATQYNISVSEFITWNPSVNTTNPCTMTEGLQYCAQNYNVMAAGITPACTELEIVPPGYTCSKFTSLYGVDESQFQLWNPSLGANCTNFFAGTWYCIAVYHYRQPGIVSTCNLFTTPNDTNWLDLPCQILETQFGLSHARFVAWNPSVNTNCSGIYLGYDYCVSIPNYKPTYSSTTAYATTLSSVPPPTTSADVTTGFGGTAATPTTKSTTTTAKVSSTSTSSTKGSVKSTSTSKSTTK